MKNMKVEIKIMEALKQHKWFLIMGTIAYIFDCINKPSLTGGMIVITIGVFMGVFLDDQRR